MNWLDKSYIFVSHDIISCLIDFLAFESIATVHWFHLFPSQVKHGDFCGRTESLSLQKSAARQARQCRQGQSMEVIYEDSQVDTAKWFISVLSSYPESD